jgi:hypothetical protein
MSRHCTARKSFVDHCSTFIFAMVVLWLLMEFKEAFPLNYLILGIWICALVVSVPSACSIVIFHQDDSESDIDELLPSTIHDFSAASNRENPIRTPRLLWPHSSSIRDNLMPHRKLIAKAGLMALTFSISLIAMELQFKLSTTHLGPHLTTLRIAFSCWWIYSLLSGLRFGGYAVSERVHRLSQYACSFLCV